MVKLCNCCDIEFNAFGPRNYYCSYCAMRVQKIGVQCVAKVQKEIRHGRMKKATAFQCVDCGERAEVYDHRDYRKPLEVEPLCTACNLRRPPAKLKLKRRPYFLIQRKFNYCWPIRGKLENDGKAGTPCAKPS